ncbi:hypothetical protein TEA_020839 [Camellia sinensis var. sinensis]|uniref:PPM-type phosphatase domain-containing protein n=1 Tax=Camellia sinensis var. sinensis TaxID=542762 RepID=A0A4S4D1J1_CAMSN|nr:hypothetical protein TEA_020839 [Camellia sinensis var. sinensis]
MLVVRLAPMGENLSTLGKAPKCLHSLNSTPLKRIEPITSLGLSPKEECSNDSTVFQVGDMSEVTINFGMEEPNDTDILTEVADTVMNIDIGVLNKDDGDNETNTSVVIEVTGCGMECNKILLEDNRDFELSDFKELQIEVIDCSSSGFDFAQEKSVHALKGCMENERREISSPVSVSQLGEKSNIENNGALNVNETMTMSNPIEAEPIPDEETSHDTLEELIDTNKSESTMKVHDGVPNVELEAQSKDLDGSEHRAVDLESETAVKREEISTAGYTLSSGVYLLPHPSKASTGGDDAYFIVGQNWLGVADGVSSWSEEGNCCGQRIDPGIYSRELMENCRKIVSKCNSIPLTNPEEVISKSNLEAKSPGSSTILVAYFDGQVLHVANIGDSGFIVIRNGVVYKKSTPRSFEFNCPFQIESGDDPSKLVEMYEIDLDEGDVIVTSTDGLFDNLYDPEIVSIVSKSMQSNFKLEEIAEALARRAHEIGNSTTCMTPFADAVAALGIEGFTGGKLDDVVVIVSLVQKISSPHMEEEISTAGYTLSSGVYLLPHPSKASTGGEDAYFIVGQNWLGVADGVGSWSEEGIDPGIYSQELMENCRKIVSECNSVPHPEEVISESALEAESPGSSTILVAYFDGQVLHVANIGDSGFIVIRNGVVYKRSTPRSFKFNCPFQIASGVDPSEYVEIYKIDLDEGDVIVTSTDGLFDNLYNPEIVSIVSKSMQSNFKLEEIAEALARRAHEIGNSRTCMTPFVDAYAARRIKKGFTGGKLDDVVVIVSLVQKISSPHME